jgi:hypothetical protein
LSPQDSTFDLIGRYRPDEAISSKGLASDANDRASHRWHAVVGYKTDGGVVDVRSFDEKERKLNSAKCSELSLFLLYFLPTSANTSVRDLPDGRISTCGASQLLYPG